MFCIKALLNCKNPHIQCHDNPDADSIASAYAISTYLSENGISSVMFYCGAKITKVNLLELLQSLKITIHHAESVPDADTLITVDCQYGGGNVTACNANKVFVIDHHRDEGLPCDGGIVRSELGSCSTLVWDLLRKVEFDFDHHIEVGTALYYGLYSDTSALSEIRHPLDRDMRDTLQYDYNLFKRLRSANLSLGELSIASKALSTFQINEDYGCAVFQADPCDPNIMGFISDLAIQVENIDVCVVYSINKNGAKLSIRSCVREVLANEFAAFLTEDMGSGGGHAEKAGGFVSNSGIGKLGITMQEYLVNRIKQYFFSYDLIYASNHSLDITTFQKYHKKKIPVSYVLSTDIFPSGTPVLVRTLEDDAEAVAGENVIFMVGIYGEAYPISAEKFKKNYLHCDDAPQKEYAYSPTAINRETGESADLSMYTHSCVATGEQIVYAKVLERRTKVFTPWYEKAYMSGDSGDFIAIREDDKNDVYIIRRGILFETYESV